MSLGRVPEMIAMLGLWIYNRRGRTGIAGAQPGITLGK